MTEMEFGFLNSMQNWHEKLDDFEMWEGEIALALAADRHGFDSLWCVEHHFDAYGMCPDNIQYLSYLAPLTKNAKLVPGAVILPWHDPLRVAEKMAMLEYFAPGRTALGIGRGLARREYLGFRQDMNESRERYAESARMVLDALNNGFIEGKGKFYKQPRVDIRPKPLRGYSDALYCVAMSEDSAMAAAELGGRMMTFIQWPIERHVPMIESYRKAFAEFHPHLAVPEPVLTDVTVCHEDAEEAKRLAYEYLSKHYVSVVKHYEFAGDHFKDIRGYEGYQAAADLIKSAGMEESQKNYVEAQNWGTPQQIIEKYRERLELIGPFFALVEFSYGGMPFEYAQNSLRLFAEKVIPEVRKMFRNTGKTATRPAVLAEQN